MKSSTHRILLGPIENDSAHDRLESKLSISSINVVVVAPMVAGKISLGSPPGKRVKLCKQIFLTLPDKIFLLMVQAFLYVGLAARVSGKRRISSRFYSDLARILLNLPQSL